MAETGSIAVPTALNQIQVGFHYGRTLLHLADSYARPTQVVLELIQNAIDAGAKNIFLKVNASRRLVHCCDDGEGESFKDLQRRFQRISEQQKERKIGHKGIGNLASLSIADVWRLTTRPRASKERFFTVELRREGLEQMADSVSLPSKRENKDFRPSVFHKLGTDFPISTLLILTGVKRTALRHLTDASELARVIESRFATHILERQIRIRIQVGNVKTETQPQPFLGTPHRTEMVTPLGTVVFELYVTPKPEKRPRLTIVHGKTVEERFSLPIEPFLELSPDIGQLFGSHHIQGNIYVPFCSLTPDRSEFEYDQELGVFWDTLEEFAKTEGRRILERLTEGGREKEIKRVLLDVLNQVIKYFQRHREDFSLGFRGQVSSGHINADLGEPGEVLRTIEERPRRPAGPTTGPKDSPQREQREKVHAGVLDETGSPRRVFNRQTGFGLDWRGPRAEESRDWRSKREGFMVILNNQHPDWQAVEDDKAAFRQYCFLLTLKELVLARQPEGPARDTFNEMFENDFVSGYIETVTS